jgi:hypothetical protein
MPDLSNLSSTYLAYFTFFFFMAVALVFFVRTAKHGYWGRNSEDAKFRMMDEQS